MKKLLLLLLLLFALPAFAQHECDSRQMFAIPAFNLTDSSGVLHQAACWAPSIAEAILPLTPFNPGPNIQLEGIQTANDPSIGNVGAAGTTTYIYCVTATDSFGDTRTNCFNTATGNATLNSTNYNTVTIAAYSSIFPFVLPVGSCAVYRTYSGGTPASIGKIGTISACAAGGTLADEGLVGDTTSPPTDSSGVIATTGPSYIGGAYISSDSDNLVIGGNAAPNSGETPLGPGWTHSVIVGTSNGTNFSNSGITSVGWFGTGNGHACTAIGYGTTCNGASGFAGAISATVSGSSATALGNAATASGGNDIAIGSSTTASGGQGVAIGNAASTTISSYGIAIGYHPSTTAGWAVAIGYEASVPDNLSIAIGYEATATGTNQFIAGGPDVTDFYAGEATSTTANIHGQSFISNSTTFTSSGGLDETTLTGGATAGQFTTATVTSGSTVITMGNSAKAPHGWHCSASDQTHPADIIIGTSLSTTTATLTVASSITAGDVIEFACIGY